MGQGSQVRWHQTRVMPAKSIPTFHNVPISESPPMSQMQFFRLGQPVLGQPVLRTRARFAAPQADLAWPSRGVRAPALYHTKFNLRALRLSASTKRIPPYRLG